MIRYWILKIGIKTFYKMIELKLFKILISYEGFRCDVYRYGIESDEIIKRLREELNEIVSINVKR